MSLREKIKYDNLTLTVWFFLGIVCRSLGTAIPGAILEASVRSVGHREEVRRTALLRPGRIWADRDI